MQFRLAEMGIQWESACITRNNDGGLWSWAWDIWIGVAVSYFRRAHRGFQSMGVPLNHLF